jgi:hypothetical protein
LPPRQPRDEGAVVPAKDVAVANGPEPDAGSPEGGPVIVTADGKPDDNFANCAVTKVITRWRSRAERVRL